MSDRLKILHYNLHNLLRIRVCTPEGVDMSYFERRFRYFKSEQQQDCDITIYFNVPKARLTIPDYPIVIRNTGRRRLGRWQVSIRKQAERKFDIIFKGNRFSQKYLVFNFLEPLINYVLIGRNCCLVHASCFADKNGAVVVHGYPSSGKTSILLRALKNSADYLSDEMTIIDASGAAYAYPTPLNFCDYNFKKDCPFTLKWPQVIKKYVSKTLRILSNGRVKPTLLIPPEWLLQGGSIVPQRPVHLSCVIADDKRDTPGQTARNLMSINQTQYTYFKAVLDNNDINPSEGALHHYWEEMLDILERFCRQVRPIVLDRHEDFEIKTASR